MSTANMKLVANYTTATAANGNPAQAPEWDFTVGNSIWKIDSANDGYPYFGLQSAPEPEAPDDAPVTPDDAPVTPDAPATVEAFYERPPVLDEPVPVNGPSYQGAPTTPPPPSILDGQLLEVEMLTPQTGSEAGMIAVTVPQNLWMPGAVFSFELPDQVKEAASGGSASITLLDGKPLPSWLQYNPETKSFTATDIPQGATEVKLLITINGKSWEVDVSMEPS